MQQLATRQQIASSTLNNNNNNRCLFFCRLKINHESHEFILESGTVANNTIHGLWAKSIKTVVAYGNYESHKGRCYMWKKQRSKISWDCPSNIPGGTVPLDIESTRDVEGWSASCMIIMPTGVFTIFPITYIGIVSEFLSGAWKFILRFLQLQSW